MTDAFIDAVGYLVDLNILVMCSLHHLTVYLLCLSGSLLLNC